MAQIFNTKFLIFLIVFSSIIQINPLPTCAEKQNNYESLIAEYEEKFAYDPYNENTKRQLSSFYHNRAGELANEGAWEKAIEREKRAYELLPEEKVIKKTLAVFYNSYGLEFRDKGYFQKAIDCMKKAIDYLPDELILKKNAAAVYLGWADELFHKNEYQNAQRMLVNAEHLDKDNPYVYVLKGEIAYAQDNYFKAQKYWMHALELNPGLHNLRIRMEKLKKENEIESNFKIRETENFKLKFEGIEKQDLVDNAAEILRNAYRDIGQDFNFYPKTTVPVIIYPDKGLKMLDYFPDWAAGTYDGKIRFGENIRIQHGSLKAVLYHEYTHVVVRALGGDNVPLWLNEGLAEFQANRFKQPYMRKARKQMLLRAISRDTIFSIDELGSMDLVKLSYLSGERIELVYAQSESFVTYIINRASLFDIKRLLASLKNGTNIYRAVKDTLYVDLDVLERDWKAEF